MTGRNQGLLELCDPLEINDTRVGRLLVPLESDLTTPLAYFLSRVPMESWPRSASSIPSNCCCRRAINKR